MTHCTERVVVPSAWSMLPGEWTRQGHRGSAAHLFSRVQRIANWNDRGPDVGKSGRRVLATCDTSLPTLIESVLSRDGSRRCVLTTVDGRRIDAVHMPRAVKNPRVTLCVSSQIGCAMGCTFCATGTMGIYRNLTAGEMLGEILTLTRAFGPTRGQDLNVVFMGMGEPMHNLAHVQRAVDVLCHQDGIGMSPNRITVSTSGLVPGIEAMASWPRRPLLAVSLNATTDATRSRVMPVNRAFPLPVLRSALQAYPTRPGERILLEYVLLRGVNDTPEDAMRLAAFAKGIPHNINLVPLNEHERTLHRATGNAGMLEFAEQLERLGCLYTVRKNRGRDVGAACGLLVQSAPR